MKKIILFIFLFMSMFLLVSCGNADKPPEKEVFNQSDYEIVLKNNHPTFKSRVDGITDFYREEIEAKKVNVNIWPDRARYSDDTAMIITSIGDQDDEESSIEIIEIYCDDFPDSFSFEDALSIAKEYLPSNLSDYTFLGSGINNRENDKCFSVCYENPTDHMDSIVVQISMDNENPEIVKSIYFNGICNQFDVLASFDEEWSYDFLNN